MTEFTQEELQIISLDMNAYIHRTTILAESPSHRTLRDKIQAMIDNYCEHQSTGDSGGLQQVCRECGKEV